MKDRIPRTGVSFHPSENLWRLVGKKVGETYECWTSLYPFLAQQKVEVWLHFCSHIQSITRLSSRGWVSWLPPGVPASPSRFARCHCQVHGGFWGVPRDEWKGIRDLSLFFGFFGGGNWDTPVNIVHRECEFADAILHDANGNFEAPNEHSEVIFLAFDSPRNPPNKTYRFQDSTEVTEIFINYSYHIRSQVTWRVTRELIFDDFPKFSWMSQESCWAFTNFPAAPSSQVSAVALGKQGHMSFAKEWLIETVIKTSQ